MNSVAITLQRSAQQKGLYLKVEHIEQLPVVLINDLDIRKVLSNLVWNSIKFTQQGGIAISDKEQADTVLVNIQDTGPGIPKDKIERVFEPFFQVGDESKKEGVGLGLAIVKDIIEANKGRIWVESEVGRGTIFSFTLPKLEKRRY